LPFDTRDRIWALIDAAAHDADPAPERDQPASDPAGLSINSNRGVAVQAAVAYGLWCARHLGDGEPSLAATPELRDPLEEKLDVERARAPFVPSSASTSRTCVTSIPTGRRTTSRPSSRPTRTSSRYRAAAWGAFVRFARFDRDLITLLLPEFRHAISKLPPEATIPRMLRLDFQDAARGRDGRDEEHVHRREDRP
jgi:hypothetical protein